MNKTQFIEKVKKMRMIQKEYFRTQDKFHLIESKKIEREVDNYLAGIINMFDGQIKKDEINYKKQIAVQLLEWMNKIAKTDPMQLETDIDDIAQMFVDDD